VSKEFDALRGEMLAWQNRRFTVLTASTSLVTGILGLDGVMKGDAVLDWGLVSGLLWFFLGSSAVLTWYAGRANAKIAAYLIVFHEADSDGWETRLKLMKDQGLDWFNLNRVVLLIYVGLGILSFVVPWAVRGHQVATGWHIIVLVVTGGWFSFGLGLLLLPGPRQRYEERWRKQGGV